MAYYSSHRKAFKPLKLSPGVEEELKRKAEARVKTKTFTATAIARQPGPEPRRLLKKNVRKVIQLLQSTTCIIIPFGQLAEKMSTDRYRRYSKKGLRLVARKEKQEAYAF